MRNGIKILLTSPSVLGKIHSLGPKITIVASNSPKKSSSINSQIDKMQSFISTHAKPTICNTNSSLHLDKKQ